MSIKASIRIVVAMLVISLVFASLLFGAEVIQAKNADAGGVQPLGCVNTETAGYGSGPCHSCNYNYYEKWHYERVCDHCWGWCSPWRRVNDPCGWCGPQ